MPNKSGNLQNIDAFVCQARYSKVAKMMESLNAIVVQGSDENALSAVAGSEACAGKLVADKRLRGTEFTFIQQREKLTRHRTRRSTPLFSPSCITPSTTCPRMSIQSADTSLYVTARASPMRRPQIPSQHAIRSRTGALFSSSLTDDDGGMVMGRRFRRAGRSTGLKVMSRFSTTGRKPNESSDGSRCEPNHRYHDG